MKLTSFAGLLTAATVGTGVIGAAFAAIPFIASWKPSARAKALGAPVEVDASKLEAGQMLKVVWRGQAVFVVRRVKATVDQLSGHVAIKVSKKGINGSADTAGWLSSSRNSEDRNLPR